VGTSSVAANLSIIKSRSHSPTKEKFDFGRLQGGANVMKHKAKINRLFGDKMAAITLLEKVA